MKKIVLTPNPYRDRNFKYVTLADKLLREAGLKRASASPSMWTAASSCRTMLF